MKTKTSALALGAVLAACLGTGLWAHGPKLHVESPGLTRTARVTLKKAENVAQRSVKGGKLVSAEIEREKGRVIYSLEYRQKGKTGHEEVNVDARTGALVDVEHENAGDELKEAREEKTEAVSEGEVEGAGQDEGRQTPAAKVLPQGGLPGQKTKP